MAIDSTHPQYATLKPDWQLVRDFKIGPRRVKERDGGLVYLPATSGQTAQGLGAGEPGLAEYEAYKARAVVPDSVTTAIEAMVGVMHRKEASISVPSGMEGQLDEITQEGESAQELLRRMTEEVLTTGRMGLLVDVEDGPNTAPFIVTYLAETIINWSDTLPGVRSRLDFVVLNESGFVLVDDFAWTERQKFRVLQLAEGLYQTFVVEDGIEQETIEPAIANNRLERIPFIFVGSTDLTTQPNDIPLLGLANHAATIYRGEADYRHTLFMQGQDTLVIKGLRTDDDKPFVGAGAFLEVDAENGDAKYIGVSASGLSEQRTALENDYTRASEMGASMLSTTGSEAESGEALRIRVAARTANLSTIAQAVAGGLEDALKIMAEWQGFDAEAVEVEANLDFADDGLAARELFELMQAKSMGLPMSQQTIHDLLRDKDITKLDFEEEMRLIEEEGIGPGMSDDEPDDEPDDDPEEDDEEEALEPGA